jgi:hypothetical protein
MGMHIHLTTPAATVHVAYRLLPAESSVPQWAIVLVHSLPMSSRSGVPAEVEVVWLPAEVEVVWLVSIRLAFAGDCGPALCCPTPARSLLPWGSSLCMGPCAGLPTAFWEPAYDKTGHPQAF